MTELSEWFLRTVGAGQGPYDDLNREMAQEILNLRSALRGEQGIAFEDGSIVNVAALAERVAKLRAALKMMYFARFMDIDRYRDQDKAMAEAEAAVARIERDE